MSLNTRDEHLIDQYLLGQLSEADQRLFQERMQASDFQAALSEAQELMGVFQSAGRDQLKAEMKNWEQKLQNSNKESNAPAKTISLNRILAIAASILLLAFIGYFWLSSENGEQKLFADNYQPYPNVVAPIEKGDADEDPTKKAFQEYELGNYEKAINLFEQIMTNQDANLFLAISHIELGNDQKAKELLIQIINQPEDRFLIPANWYLGLLNVKEGNLEAAKKYLNVVSKDTEYQVLQSKAKSLLNQL